MRQKSKKPECWRSTDTTTEEPCGSGQLREPFEDAPIIVVKFHPITTSNNIPRPHRLKKTSSMHSARLDPHPKWPHCETNDNTSPLKAVFATMKNHNLFYNVAEYDSNNYYEKKRGLNLFTDVHVNGTKAWSKNLNHNSAYFYMVAQRVCIYHRIHSFSQKFSLYTCSRNLF